MNNYFNENLEEIYTKNTDVNYRRKLGQFFTPFKIAQFMSEWIIPNKKRKMKVLDPAAGFGIFERALLSIDKSKTKEIEFHLWEIDRKIYNNLIEIVQNLKLNAKVHNEDFLNSSWSKRYDGIIANPPYYKHHYIQNKNELYKNICLKTFFKFSLLTNIYCWFLIKSLSQLKEGGRLSFIVPSEFLNANYGEKVKSYLLSLGVIIHLININFKENIFNNALTTSVIILAEKRKEKINHINFYNINNINQITELNKFLKNCPHKAIKIKDLDPKIKWRNYFNGYELNEWSSKLISFSRVGRFKRGIATGANNYFTLTKDEVIEYNLPNKCLIPCITKANFVKDIIFTQEDFNKLINSNKKVYLFNGESSNNKSVIDYIKRGEKEGINKRYLTRNRKPWYSLEKRAVSTIWVSVFGRSGLKFIRNESKCLNLTCFHAFYPTEYGKGYLDILFLYLNTKFAKNLFEIEKREYGNGLEKFEPNDINKSLFLDFSNVTEEELIKLKKIQKKFLSFSKNERNEILDKADSIFRKVFQSI